MGTLSQAALDKFDARLIAPFGTIGINADDQAVTSLVFLGPDVSAKAPTKNTLAHLACVQLMSYFKNPKFTFDLPVRLSGSKHQLDVWHAMQNIRAGNTLTYGALAEQIGSNARAVGTACGKNPVPIVVPCHRIVAASGLGGFMGGKREDPLAIKRWLLTHEGATAVSTAGGKAAGKMAGSPSLF
ncbi:MAG: methylated-DNA--[protein]-cysteine S-methyltransferase [Rhodocyclaceae bacterium]|jgi:methylated-DNA-[protein]-cysteine S-methyltransferase|nr:methylated-DNA--[protein]-cysteine S-methyltransferase [Rhodocyclaceae bacterium]